MDTTGCLLAIMGVLLIPIAYILHGWVLSLLWGWFAVPVFNVPELNVMSAIGLSIAVSMFRKYEVPEWDEDDKNIKALMSTLYGFAIPLFILLIGWITFLIGGSNG